AHLAWGAGPHACLGRELATTITTIAVERLFDRFSGLRLALPADQLPWRSSPMIRGLRALPVKYELAEEPPQRSGGTGGARRAGRRLAPPADRLPGRRPPMRGGLRALPVNYGLAEAPPQRSGGTGAAARSGAETTPETDSAAPEPGSLVRRILRMIRLAQS